MARLWGVAVWALLLGSYLFVPSQVRVTRPRVARQAVDNNRANQLNPNNAQYHKSRGRSLPSQRCVEKEGHVEKKANNLTPRNKGDIKALKPKIRSVVPSANLKRVGSRLNMASHERITKKPLMVMTMGGAEDCVCQHRSVSIQS